MIEESKRSLAIKKYVAGSEELAKMLSIKKEMEDLIIDKINSTYSDKEVEIARRNRNSVYFQNDISIEYELCVSWNYRHYLTNMDHLTLKHVDKPAVILSTSDITSESSPLKEIDEDFYNSLKSKLAKINAEGKCLQKKLDALNQVLSDKAMNITSVKKYYPELYNLMS